MVEIISSRGEHIKVDTDEAGRVTCVSIKQDNEEVKLVRYRYDEQGNMIETIDALNVSKYFFYKENHLLIRLVNQGGMSFHWEYEGNGENARCIHTWGDGGVMEYYIHYGKGTTVSVMAKMLSLNISMALTNLSIKLSMPMAE